MILAPINRYPTYNSDLCSVLAQKINILNQEQHLSRRLRVTYHYMPSLGRRWWCSLERNSGYGWSYVISTDGYSIDGAASNMIDCLDRRMAGNDGQI